MATKKIYADYADALTGKLFDSYSKAKKSSYEYSKYGGYENAKPATPEIDLDFKDLEDIAISAMRELEANGHVEVILLKNEKVREWWVAIKEEERKDKVVKDALAKLSDEEKQLLGL
ncbi:MAG TPA: hypothetical protein VFM18_18940 [Methanosarcina sp.]|nr:hypothetical protein [Methanosarcina sp.]